MRIATLLLATMVLAGGCAKGGGANDTAIFLGADERWPSSAITLRDVQGLSGGTDVFLSGSGQSIIRIVDGQVEKRYVLKLTPDEVLSYRQGLVQADLVTVHTKDRMGVPDEARPTIILRNHQGQEHQVAKWGNDKNARFDLVYKQLLSLRDKTRDMKPVYVGKYDPDWRPDAPTTRPATQPARQSGNLVIRDASGNVVARGDLRLPDQLPSSGKTFEGSWQLKSAEKSFPSGSTRSGKYSGNVHDQGIAIDLNPSLVDNNVVLSGSVSNGSLSGKWYHATFSGGKEMGTFTITTAAGDAR